MMIADAIATAAGGAAWMVGGMVATVDMSMLFDVDDGVSAAYSGTSSDESVVGATTTGGTMLALTPMDAGMATITVTGSDTAGGGVATVTHDATVVLQTLTIEVTADTMAIMEGGSGRHDHGPGEPERHGRHHADADGDRRYRRRRGARVHHYRERHGHGHGHGDAGTGRRLGRRERGRGRQRWGACACSPRHPRLHRHRRRSHGQRQGRRRGVIAVHGRRRDGVHGRRLGAGRRGGGARHEHAVHDQRKPDSQLRGDVVERHGRGQRQRFDADADADGHR